MGAHAAFPEWPEVMDGWGSRMLATVSTVAEVIAVGLGLPQDAFSSRMHLGPHLLAPTGMHAPPLEHACDHLGEICMCKLCLGMPEVRVYKGVVAQNMRCVQAWTWASMGGWAAPMQASTTT